MVISPSGEEGSKSMHSAIWATLFEMASLLSNANWSAVEVEFSVRMKSALANLVSYKATWILNVPITHSHLCANP